MRLEAALALGQIGKPALSSLLKVRENEDPEMQTLAVIAIGEMADEVPEAIPVLQAACNSTFDRVRHEAEKALGAIPSIGEEKRAPEKGEGEQKQPFQEETTP